MPGLDFEPLFSYIFKGNKQASELAYMLLSIAHTWDDLVDKDKEVSAEQANTVFVDCLFNLQAHPLWGIDLQSNLLCVYFRWQSANSIEADKNSTDNDLAMAWMLRASLYDLFILTAAKLYGISWAVEIAPVVHRYYGEPLQNFIQEIRNA